MKRLIRSIDDDDDGDGDAEESRDLSINQLLQPQC